MPTSIERTATRAAQLQSFFDTHDRTPSIYGTESESSLYIWWANVRRQAIRGTLSDAARHTLDEACPRWHEEPSWNHQPILRSRELGDFVRAHHRWPIQAAEDLKERRLHDWLSRQRTRMRANRLNHLTEEALDTNAPGWRTASVAKPFRERVEELEAHFTRAGDWPSSANANREEQSLARWLYHARIRAKEGKLNRADHEMLDAKAPGWNASPEERNWHTNLRRVISFVSAHGRIPSAADTTDAEAHQWISRQRGRLTAGTLSAERQMILDENAPGWRDTAQHSFGRAARAEALAAYVQTSGRWPARKDPDPAVRSLERWWREHRTRQASGALDAGIAALLDEKCPGWRELHA